MTAGHQDADRTGHLERATNRACDCEVVLQDIRADLERDLQRLRDAHRALAAAREELERARWVAQIEAEGPHQPEPADA